MPVVVNEPADELEPEWCVRPVPEGAGVPEEVPPLAVPWRAGDAPSREEILEEARLRFRRQAQEAGLDPAPGLEEFLNRREKR